MLTVKIDKDWYFIVGDSREMTLTLYYELNEKNFTFLKDLLEEI